MATPIVIIIPGVDLADFYNAIVKSLDARYHAPGNTFPTYTISDCEMGEIETLTAYAASFDTSAGPPSGVNVENWTA